MLVNRKIEALSERKAAQTFTLTALSGGISAYFERFKRKKFIFFIKGLEKYEKKYYN